MLKLKIKTTEMKNLLEDLSSRFKKAGKGISKLEDRSIEIIQPKEQKEKEKWLEPQKSMGPQGHQHAHNWIPRQRGEAEAERDWRNNVENFPNLIERLIYTSKKLNTLKVG